MSFSEYYTDLKILHHSVRVEQLKKGEQPYPISLRLVLSDLCNHNCHFCTFRMANSFTNKKFGEFDSKKGVMNFNPKRFLSLDKSLEIIADCKKMNIKSIEFTGGGEPTVHPNHIEIFNKVHESGIDMGLITNGALFRKGFTDAVLKSAWCRFSLDAGNAKTYSKIREVPEKVFDKVLKNIAGLVLKRKSIKSKTTLGVSFIVTDQNYSEVYDAAKIISALGVDYFRIGYYRTDEGFAAGDYDQTCKMIGNAIKDLSRDDFKIIDRYSEASSNIDGAPDYDFCAYQHVSTWISADYNVYRCCVTSYDDHGLIGSIKDQSFKTLWDSAEKRKKMDCFNARSCEQCIYNKKNKVLNYIIGSKPSHINFM